MRLLLSNNQLAPVSHMCWALREFVLARSVVKEKGRPAKAAPPQFKSIPDQNFNRAPIVYVRPSVS